MPAVTLRDSLVRFAGSRHHHPSGVPFARMWDERADFTPLICWGLEGVFAAFWRPSQCRLEMAVANTASLARLDVNLSLGAMRLGKSFASYVPQGCGTTQPRAVID